jgi:hypothetical protein
MTQTDIHAESNRIIGLYVAKQEAIAKAAAEKKSVKEPTAKFSKTACKKIYNEAYAAGIKAGNEVGVPKFVVGEPTTPLGGNIDYSKPTYILDGLCGFAWVDIFPARGSFVTFLKSQGIGDKNYNSGYGIWIKEFGQSVDRKYAFAQAFAEVLQKYGIRAYAGSRLD